MIITKYLNGNAEITLFSDGSRVVSFEDHLDLESPLNIDIRVSTSCSFADNLCAGFCHESAVVNGKDCDYNILKAELNDLLPGTELAIGSNRLTKDLYYFLSWCLDKGFICNITVNQGHTRRDLSNILSAINDGYIKGLGISYRNSLKWDIPKVLLSYPNTVFHVIAGIDSINDIIQLAEKGVKKILVLGEKDFGFNTGNVDLSTQKHKEWYWWVHKMFSLFEVVSFDNLALEQLNIKRFLSKEHWDIFYQAEHSFYINAVDQYFSPSSRDPNRTDFNKTNIKQYFKQLNKYETITLE